ncbi:type III secretion system inner membrane ring lipoprotein SctJ [Thiolapillus sp.]
MKQAICMVLVLLLLTGCNSETLYSQLSEQEANEMVALLYNAGIEARKISSKDDTFAVSTVRDHFSRAVELLRSNGYPRNRFVSLGEVFKKEGFVSSPLEERARLNYAQSQELTKTIESIDGVILARVHLAVPEADPLSEKVQPSSASVFIKYRRGMDFSKHVGQIKAMVVNSVEGLPYDNVTVALFPAAPMPARKPVASPPVKPLDLEAVPIPAVALGGVTAMLGGLGTWLFLRRRKDAGSLPMEHRGE